MSRYLASASTLMTILFLAGCSYNPLNGNNHMTGTPTGTLGGAAVGGAGGVIAGASKPGLLLSTLAGGAAGYYFSSLRYDASGIYRAGGQVYQLGLNTGIYVPSDMLFEPNTADFLPQAEPILDSMADVLERQPDNNILISGSTSGFGRQKYDQKLSEQRAGKVASYLWNAGINNFKDPHNDMRKLNYVGYGNYFPIANRLTNNALRANSYIQITSYPSDSDLHLDKRHLAFHNIGSFKDDVGDSNAKTPCGKHSCYEDIGNHY